MPDAPEVDPMVVVALPELLISVVPVMVVAPVIVRPLVLRALIEDKLTVLSAVILRKVNRVPSLFSN
jgi:hypothetical protein